jgi:hypothetical protein
MANKNIRIVGEYVITENPFDGRLVAVHYSDGTQTIVRR